MKKRGVESRVHLFNFNSRKVMEDIVNNLIQLEAKCVLQDHSLSEQQIELLDKDAQIIALRTEVERLRDAIGHLHFDKPSDAYEHAARIEQGVDGPMGKSSLSTELWWCREIARTVLKT